MIPKRVRIHVILSTSGGAHGWSERTDEEAGGTVGRAIVDRSVSDGLAVGAVVGCRVVIFKRSASVVETAERALSIGIKSLLPLANDDDSGIGIGVSGGLF